jgi:PAS domain S-box-containing protein
MSDLNRTTNDVPQPTRNDDGARWDEQRYRALFELGPVAVYSCDAAGVIQEFNRRAVELWGCEPVVGDTDKRFCGSFKLFRPDGTYMPHDECPMAEVVAGTLSQAADAEVLIERPDGSRITVIVNIRPLKNQDGQVIGAINCFYDITSRKQTEDALRQSLEDLTRMQQVSTRLLQAGDFSLLLHDILDAAIEITGAQMGNIQLLEGDVLRITAQRGFDRPFLEFFASVHGEQAACGAALQRGERVIVDDVLNSPIFAGTSALDVMIAAGARAVQSTPLVSRSGRVLGMFSTHYRRAPQQPSGRVLRLLDILARQAADLIEHKQGEEALRTREADLELVINQTAFMLTRCTRDLRYQFVSRTYAEMIGRQPADVAGRAIVEIMGEKGFETIRPYIETVLKGTRVEFECDLRIKGIGIRSLRVVYTPDTDERGRVQGWIASILDISERKQVEEARALLAGIVESSDDAIISKSLNGIITSWNAGAERVFGYAAAEAIGQSIGIIIPAERQQEEVEIIQRLSQGEKIEHFETQRVAKDGRYVPISITVSPVRNRQGVVIGASKIARDITDRLRAEDERTRLLASEQAAREQAEEANRAKDEFLATASHELRTPLNAILGWATMLEQAGSLDGRASKGLQSITRNARTLAQLVDDLLDVSRLISGKMRLDVAPMDLGVVIDAAVETILPVASAKDISIVVAVDPAGRAMMGDATRLQQTVGNLLSNAVKFTAAGGRVEVRTRRDDGQLELTVTDSGIGIEAAFLPYVFDRFRQADASGTRAQSGLGLGLAIVRHLVELHGGSVRAESDGRDAGTRFVVRLPRRHVSLTAHDARSPADASATPAATDVPQFEGLRILVVDDDRESCEMMLEALRRHGASVQCALSATEAIATLQEFRPDLVLSDIAMPGRDGYAVLSEIRAVETMLGRRVPVAAVSAYAHEEDRQRAIAAGFDQYLAKPVDPAALASTVRALVAIGNRRVAEPHSSRPAKH